MTTSEVSWQWRAAQKNFYNRLSRHMASPDRPGPLLLEGGTGIGKTRAFLQAVAKSSKRVALVLPTHELINQLMNSADLGSVGLRVGSDIEVFRPERYFKALGLTAADYEGQKQRAMQCRVMVCTQGSLVIDQRAKGAYNGAIHRDYLLFDEADQIADMTALQSDLLITQDQLLALGISTLDPREALTKLQGKRRALSTELRAAVDEMLKLIDEPQKFATIGLTDDNSIALTHRLPGRMIKHILGRSNVCLVSATLTVNNKFEPICHGLGIEKGSISELSGVIEPEHHGELTFEFHDIECGSGRENHAWFEAVVDAIHQSQGPTLVATTSHDLSKTLTLATQPRDDLLIKAAAWAGLDFRDPPRTIIIPKVPFQQPVVVDGRIESSYLDSRNTAIRRLRQVIGRGLRSENAKCHVVILDGRAKDLASAFVPKRFQRAWERRKAYLEGHRVERFVEEAQRVSHLRDAALEHYGMRCMHQPFCRFGVTEPMFLDVHHKNPIATGARLTRMEDVEVLCKIHHAYAHEVMRQSGFQGVYEPKSDVPSIG